MQATNVQSATSESSHSTPLQKENSTLQAVNQHMISHNKTLIANDSKTPFEYDELNIDDLVEQVDPQLWDTICTLTKSKAENRNTSMVTDPHSGVHYIKKVRRFFLLCMMMFCIDDRCSMPMHTLVTDMVDSQGGSAGIFLSRVTKEILKPGQFFGSVSI